MLTSADEVGGWMGQNHADVLLEWSRMLPLYATISNVNQEGLWQIPTNDLTLISLFLPTMHERPHKRLGLSLENR